MSDECSIHRHPNLACDYVDMGVANRLCPNPDCYKNEMYTDGIVDYCGYCGWIIPRENMRYIQTELNQIANDLIDHRDTYCRDEYSQKDDLNKIIRKVKEMSTVNW